MEACTSHAFVNFSTYMHTKYISFHTTHIHLFPNIHNYRIAMHLYLAFLKVNSLEIYFMFIYFYTYCSPKMPCICLQHFLSSYALEKYLFHTYLFVSKHTEAKKVMHLSLYSYCQVVCITNISYIYFQTYESLK